MPTRLTGLTTILFDADGTLWDFEATMRRALALTLAEMARLVPGCDANLSVASLLALRDATAREHAGEGWSHESIRLESFRRALKIAGAAGDRLAPELTRFYLEQRFTRAYLYDDAVPALEALRLRYALGLVTNGNSYPERCGLKDYFAFVLIGQDHGLHKPDPRIYDLALRMAGCSAQQAVSVGDSMENDVGAPQACGIAGVWLNRLSRSLPAGAAPDRVVCSLLELLTFL